MSNITMHGVLNVKYLPNKQTKQPTKQANQTTNKITDQFTD